jgi:hypothetical protein
LPSPGSGVIAHKAAADDVAAIATARTGAPVLGCTKLRWQAANVQRVDWQNAGI